MSKSKLDWRIVHSGVVLYLKRGSPMWRYLKRMEERIKAGLAGYEHLFRDVEDK